MIKQIRRQVLLITILLISFIVILCLKGGGLTKVIKDIEGVSIDVPKNFPSPVLIEEKDLKILSFNLKPHENSQRFILFFEIISSPSKIDFLKRMPYQDYKIENEEEENILINSREVSLKIISFETVRNCGSKEKFKLYAVEYYRGDKNNYLYILTFSMTKKGFLGVVKTLKCR